MRREDNNDGTYTHYREPGVGYAALNTTDAPGWDPRECDFCGLLGFAGKDVEQCDGGHLICDDCGATGDCPLCDGGKA